MSEWISVNDEMPSNYEDVMIFPALQSKAIWFGVWNGCYGWLVLRSL